MTNNFNRTYWFLFFSLILLIKIIVFMADPLPMLYLGDSHSYITTSLTGWIPLDRSFFYGFVIRLTAVSSHSLTSLILLQILTSAVNAVLLSYILISYFNSKPAPAFIMGILCTLEPLQLLYERYIMTESLSLFFFVLYLFVIFSYLKKGSIIYLGLLQFAGTILIAFRLSFLPLIMLNTFLLPLMIMFSHEKQSVNGISGDERKKYRDLFSFQLSRKAALHLVISVILMFSLHAGYKHLNGYLSKKPPAYQYQSGIFLASYLSPLIKPVDFPIPALREKIFGTLKYDISDRHKRAENHWQPGGFVSNLNKTIPDTQYAEHSARQTVLNALKRDPFGIIKLGAAGFFDYWNLDILRCNMQSDRGDTPLPPELLEVLSNKFSLSAQKLPFMITLTNRYFLFSWPWYLFLLCTPFIAAVFLMNCSKIIKRYYFIIFIACLIIVVNASVLIEGPTVRYIHSLGWLGFLVFGPICSSLLETKTARKFLSGREI